MNYRQNVLDYVKKKYGTDPEYPWRAYPEHLVLRHKLHRGEKKAKWYGIIMHIKRSVLGLSELPEADSSQQIENTASKPDSNIGKYDSEAAFFDILGFHADETDNEYVDVLNVKLEPDMIAFLLHTKGFLPAYHMNKQFWISILLDGSVPMDQICQQIDDSFVITASAKERKTSKRFGPRDWIVPANPKYYDVIGAFQTENIIEWKQSSDVRVGDLIYMYVAAPYSALMYKCKAVEVDIPYDFQSKGLIVKKVMRIQLLNSYDPDFMPFSRMKDEYGVYAVRGPRSMPNSLKAELERYSNTPR